jgi:hypothetical protein
MVPLISIKFGRLRRLWSFLFLLKHLLTLSLRTTILLIDKVSITAVSKFWIIVSPPKPDAGLREDKDVQMIARREG